MALEAIKRILAAESAFFLGLGSKFTMYAYYNSQYAVHINSIILKISPTPCFTEAAQLGNVQEVRTKIVAALACQFGGPLRKGSFLRH